MNDYVSGGYYVVKAIPRPSDLSDNLSNNLLTVSRCFTVVMRHVIQLQWDNYENVGQAIAEEARRFAIPPPQIPK